MNIKKAIHILQSGSPVVVDGKTIEPEQVERVKLESGEELFWVRTDGSLWLSIDPSSDDLMFFQDIDEVPEAGDDTVLYNGEDYELSLESVGRMFDEEGEEIDSIEFKDFEAGADILRITAYEVTGDTVASVGTVVPEEALQEI